MPKGHLFKWLLVSFVILLLDQVTKQLSLHYLSLYNPVNVFPGFNLTLAYNYGASFSFLSDQGGWQRWFFVIVSTVITGILIHWLRQVESEGKLQAFSISLVIGGAVGNLLDRLYYGYVIDFIEVYYDKWSWPIFNIADSAVCTGAFLLILLLAREKKEVS